jgi:HlyD family secretion protein
MGFNMRKLFVLCLVSLLCACKESGPRYNGYIDADLTYLSSDYSGRLQALLVHRGEMVKKNQPLFKLEHTSERYGVRMSRLNKDALLAQMQGTEAQLHYAEINYRRVSEMKKHNAASDNDLDMAKRDVDVLKDQWTALQFQMHSSEVDIANRNWQLARKAGAAIDAGLVFDTYYTPDEYVPTGQPVLSLITKRNIKAIFFVGEKELTHIQLNQKVTISSDDNAKLATGSIRYIANIAQYTPPIIYSRENRQTLVFRVEAGIDSPDLQQIHLGQPVSVELAR